MAKAIKPKKRGNAKPKAKKSVSKKTAKEKEAHLFHVSWISEWEKLTRGDERCRFSGVKRRVLNALSDPDEKKMRFARIRTTSTTDVVSHVIVERIRKSDVVIVDLSAKENAELATKPSCEVGASFRKSFNPNVLWEFGVAFAFLTERIQLLGSLPDEGMERLKIDGMVPNVRAIFVAIRQESKAKCGSVELHRLLPADMLGFYLNIYGVDKKGFANFDDGKSFAAMLRNVFEEFNADIQRHG